MFSQKISVAMCTYNGELFIEEQLRSIINQTQSVNEIIICDDYSTDNTLAIANQILKESSLEYEIFVNEQQLGVLRNFEKAIGMCTGDIVFLCDQDDIWETDKVEHMAKAFTEDVVYVFSDGILINQKDAVISKSLLKSFNYSFDANNLVDLFARKQQYPNGCLLAIKKDFFGSIQPFKDSTCGLYHDTWLGITSVLFGKSVFVNKKLIQYRIHMNSTTQGKEGQDKWLKNINAGDQYDRRFSLNPYRAERALLMENALKLAKSKNRKVNIYYVAYKKSVSMYEHLVRVKNKSKIYQILIFIKLFLNGSYYFRNLNRTEENTLFRLLKLFISDLCFIINY